MDQLEALRAQLQAANVSDEMMANGVRLTDTGMAKLCARLGVDDNTLRQLISKLAQAVQDEQSQVHNVININEQDEDERYTYESDWMGNVQIRDTKTGKSHFIQGDDGIKLLNEIRRVGGDYQAILAPYFEQHLREFIEEDVHGDMGNSGGTYNFPYRGQFACARFYMSGSKPVVEVISLVNQAGEEVPMDAPTKADLNRVAWEWVDKV